MDNNYIYRCSQGCRNCPRMRGCLAGDAVPVSAEASIPERNVPAESAPVESVPAAPASIPVESVPAVPAQAEAAPMPSIQTEPVPAETVLPQDEPEAGGVGLPALDTPADSVPSTDGETPAANSAMDEYLETNCEQGILRIQAFRGQQAIPVEGADITVRCPIGGDEMIFFQGSTDASGVIDPILLPAPKPETSLSPGMSNPCSEYEIIAEHPEFETLTTKVMVFPGIKTIQPLQMNLKAV